MVAIIWFSLILFFGITGTMLKVIILIGIFAPPLLARLCKYEVERIKQNPRWRYIR
jgi:hypothetical protein